MIETWRWFGPSDPISLAQVRQTGATGIVTALHEIPNGELWGIDAINARKEMIAAAGLTWLVAESVPVHEDIKTASTGWEALADTWAESVVNLARCGIKTICYNFMPVLDWTRTDLAFELPDGARCLRFDHDVFAAFDMFILKRPGAQAEHGDHAAARSVFDAMSEPAKRTLTATILAGLPGAEESYTLDQFRDQLARYDLIGAAELRNNLARFLDRVLPSIDAAGAKLAIHPDDPPRPLFGLPRIVSTAKDLAAIAAMS
ncbi:MAG: mannonate dehydratase, partial [Marinosulfonomonas sp.]|nr:mannonate dehydratase [Marinosulfonomonas sp.]